MRRRNKRTAHRSHAMLRSADIDDNAALTTNTSIPPCLKMWFPCDETSGPTITDAVTGAVFTPSSIDFSVDNAVRMPTNLQQALTSGVFPEIGTKDFIVMSCYYHDSDPTFGGATVRPEATLRFRNSGVTCYANYDGDGIELYDSAGNFQAGTETLCGASGNGVTTDAACHAMVRNGVSVGNWLQNETWNLAGSDGLINDFVEDGEMFARTMRVDGWGGSPNAGTFGTEDVGRNDLGVSDAVINSYRTSSVGESLRPAIIYQDGLENIGGGIPGVWVSTETVQDIATPDTLQIGMGLAAGIHYYGIAIFVFDNGLPSDFKQALRWMKAQWELGNKVIWPNWVTQK